MEKAIETLNVTLIEPRFKHPTIFDKFDQLENGNAFIILNDHDPKPLYYQLLAERGNTFGWEYLENGPQTWQVKISKRATEEEATIGEMVAKDFRKAQVFKKFGIDFCCGGKKALTEVCEKKGIDIHQVEAELSAIERTGGAGSANLNFDQWDLGFLSDYIINTHHRYVRDSIPFLSELSRKVAAVHGNEHPELIKIAEVFAEVASDLSNHLVKEESILFPYIKELCLAQRSGVPLPESHFGEINNPIKVMEMEHEGAGEDLSEIRELSNNFTLPAGACNSYTILFKKLDEFENDLHQHVHLENNILFPKAIKLEKELRNK